MFLGVSEGVNGYDVDDGEGGIQGGREVTVREEVERLTAMYEAVVVNAQNNYPDLWASGGTCGAPNKTIKKTGRLFNQSMGAKGVMQGWGSGAGGARIPHIKA